MGPKIHGEGRHAKVRDGPRISSKFLDIVGEMMVRERTARIRLS